MIVFYLPGGIPVTALALLLGFGAAGGMVWVLQLSSGEQSVALLENCLWLLLGCLLGARTGYVAAHWAYFRIHPQEIYQVQLGGLTWAGATVGGLVSLFALAAIQKSSASRLADGLVPLVSGLAIGAWLGCWLDGCAYGASSTAWWAVPTLDEWGLIERRLPVQLLGASLFFGLQIVIARARHHITTDGIIAALWFAVFSILMLVLSLLRVDPTPHWQDIRVDTLAAGFFLGIALLMMRMIWLLATPKQEKSGV